MYFTKTAALLAATSAARRTGRAMYVYSLTNGRTWAYASGSWIKGMSEPLPELTEVRP